MGRPLTPSRHAGQHNSQRNVSLPQQSYHTPNSRTGTPPQQIRSTSWLPPTPESLPPSRFPIGQVPPEHEIQASLLEAYRRERDAHLASTKVHNLLPFEEWDSPFESSPSSPPSSPHIWALQTTKSKVKLPGWSPLAPEFPNGNPLRSIELKPGQHILIEPEPTTIVYINPVVRSWNHEKPVFDGVDMSDVIDAQVNAEEESIRLGAMIRALGLGFSQLENEGFSQQAINSIIRNHLDGIGIQIQVLRNRATRFHDLERRFRATGNAQARQEVLDGITQGSDTLRRTIEALGELTARLPEARDSLRQLRNTSEDTVELHNIIKELRSLLNNAGYTTDPPAPDPIAETNEELHNVLANLRTLRQQIFILSTGNLEFTHTIQSLQRVNYLRNIHMRVQDRMKQFAAWLRQDSQHWIYAEANSGRPFRTATLTAAETDRLWTEIEPLLRWARPGVIQIHDLELDAQLNIPAITGTFNIPRAWDRVARWVDRFETRLDWMEDFLADVALDSGSEGAPEGAGEAQNGGEGDNEGNGGHGDEYNGGYDNGDWENEDGENEDGENEDGENEDGENEDGENEDGENEDGENEDGENEDGENEDGENEDGENEDGENEDGENEDGENEDGDNEDENSGDEDDGDEDDGDENDGNENDGNDDPKRPVMVSPGNTSSGTSNDKSIRDLSSSPIDAEEQTLQQMIAHGLVLFREYRSGPLGPNHAVEVYRHLGAHRNTSNNELRRLHRDIAQHVVPLRRRMGSLLAWYERHLELERQERGAVNGRDESLFPRSLAPEFRLAMMESTQPLFENPRDIGDGYLQPLIEMVEERVNVLEDIEAELNYRAWLEELFQRLTRWLDYHEQYMLRRDIPRTQLREHWDEREQLLDLVMRVGQQLDRDETQFQAVEDPGVPNRSLYRRLHYVRRVYRRIVRSIPGGDISNDQQWFIWRDIAELTELLLDWGTQITGEIMDRGEELFQREDYEPSESGDTIMDEVEESPRDPPPDRLVSSSEVEVEGGFRPRSETTEGSPSQQHTDGSEAPSPSSMRQSASPRGGLRNEATHGNRSSRSQTPSSTGKRRSAPSSLDSDEESSPKRRRTSSQGWVSARSERASQGENAPSQATDSDVAPAPSRSSDRTAQCETPAAHENQQGCVEVGSRAATAHPLVEVRIPPYRAPPGPPFVNLSPSSSSSSEEPDNHRGPVDPGAPSLPPANAPPAPRARQVRRRRSIGSRCYHRRLRGMRTSVLHTRRGIYPPNL